MPLGLNKPVRESSGRPERAKVLQSASQCFQDGVRLSATLSCARQSWDTETPASVGPKWDRGLIESAPVGGTAWNAPPRTDPALHDHIRPRPILGRQHLRHAYRPLRFVFAAAASWSAPRATSASASVAPKNTHRTTSPRHAPRIAGASVFATRAPTIPRTTTKRPSAHQELPRRTPDGRCRFARSAPGRDAAWKDRQYCQNGS